MARPGCVVGLALALLVIGPAAPAYADEAAGGTVELGEEPAPAAPRERGWSWARFGESTFDLLVLRPLGAAATVGGAAAFLVAGPLVAGSWGIGSAWDIFVLQPAEYTFVRPLGEL